MGRVILRGAARVVLAGISFLASSRTQLERSPNQNLPGRKLQMKKTLVLSASFMALLAMASLTLKASGNHTYDYSSDGKLVRVVNPSPATTAAPGVDSKFKLVAGNLSAYPLATFFSIYGNTIAQGGANFPFQTWVANPFTPTANANLAAIQVAVGRLGSGT